VRASAHAPGGEDPIRVLFVEDDIDLRDSVAESLEDEGIAVDPAGSATEFYARLKGGRYDVAVIDLGLPDGRGRDIAARVRATTDMGVVIMTARGQLRDRIDGYESGADAYLVKPVDVRELALVIRRLAERTAPARARPHAAAWTYDPLGSTLTDADGRRVELTTNENRFIGALVDRQGEEVSRDAIFEALGYRADNETSAGNLEALVRRLRLKISERTGARAPVRTVHGFGYAFAASARIDS
jgi:DNA-binding response OmpR family regulator